jgi:hypothetical protein
MTAATITYRKTQQGEWVAYGPAAVMRKGAVTVTKKDGSIKTEHVGRLGKTFTVAGVPMVYGYLEQRSSGFASQAGAREYRSNRSAYSRRRCVSGGNCSSFGAGTSCGAPDCDGY